MDKDNLNSRSVNITTLRSFLEAYKKKLLEDNDPVIKKVDIKIDEFDITQDAQKVYLYKYNFNDTNKAIISDINIDKDVLINCEPQDVNPFDFNLLNTNLFNIEKIKKQIIISKYSEDKMINYENWYVLKRTPYFLLLNIERIITKLKTPGKFSIIDKCILGLEDIKELHESQFDNKFLAEFLDSKKLNEAQTSAFKKMVSAENLTLIKGPPGTGKTTLIEHFLHYSLLRESKRRLIFATNLHSSMDAIIDKVNKNSFLKQKKILRLTKKPHSRRTAKHKELNISKLAHIYVTTLASQRMNVTLNEKKFWFNDLKPILILDEASASNILGVLSHTSQIEKIIVIGDDQQLSPIYDSKYYQYFKDENYEKEFNYFFINSFFNFIYNKNKNNCTFLNINYRSQPSIVNFINNFYNGELKANEEQNEIAFEVFRSSNYEKSKKAFLYQMNNQHLTVRNTIFMCEYKKVIKDLDISLGKKIFSTTTSIQGNEADNVCIFLARNFDTNDFRSQLDYRTVNVAISRAKKKVYIFSYDNIIDKPLINKSNYWQRIIKNGRWTSISDLISTS